MNLSFIYFNFPFLRAEVNRVALHIGNIKYNDIWVTHDELIRAKDPGKLDNGTIIPFHKFLCLIIEYEVLAQTAGIARYCGKLSALYPKKNDTDLNRKFTMLEKSVSDNSKYIIQSNFISRYCALEFCKLVHIRDCLRLS